MKENLEEKYRYLINKIQDSIIETDFDGTITYINPYVYSMFGYQENELIGSNVFKFIHPKDLSYYKEVVQKGIKSGGNFSVEFRAHHKKGHYVLVSGKCVVVKINGNKKVIGVLRDITERKKMEKALRKSEELFRTIFNTAIDSIFIKDTSLRYVKVNSAMEKLFGKKSEDLLYKTDIDLFGEEVGKHIIESDRQVIKGKIIEEFPTKPIDGVNHSFHTIKIPLKDMKGKIVGHFGIARDITDLKKAEKKLKESEERFRTLYENIAGGTVIIDEDCIIKDVNDRTCEITGYTKVELIGQLCDILCSKGSTSNECPIWVKGQEGFRGMDTVIKCKDGKENPILKNAKKIEIDGKNYILENFQDITERKMAEIKLQEINELKTEIMRRVSHELKTPLISIKGFSDLLLDAHYNKFDDDIISIVNQIKQGCVRLENLIDEILESSKLDSRQIKLKTSKEDLSFLIRFCVEELKMLLKMRNQAVILNIHDNLSTVFEKEKIYDVINNLLSNAIKYSQKNSEIKIQSEIKDNFIVISVNDNGIGFTEEEKKKLFTQFGRIERYGQRFDVESEGTGLGLYIAKKIVELHGGKIWMESEGRNKGSIFYFSLPMIKE